MLSFIGDYEELKFHTIDTQVTTTFLKSPKKRLDEIINNTTKEENVAKQDRMYNRMIELSCTMLHVSNQNTMHRKH